MASLTADQMDELLGQAEQRLDARDAGKTPKPFVSLQGPAPDTDPTSATQAPVKPEKIALRVPQREERAVKVRASSRNLSLWHHDDENAPLAAPLTWARHPSWTPPCELLIPLHHSYSDCLPFHTSSKLNHLASGQ